MRILLLLCCAWLLLFGASAISIDDGIKYKNLEHFDYVNPHAPKGGTLRAYSLGTFDSLNQFIIKGNAATGLELVYDTLMVQSKDEPFSEYGLVASDIENGKDYVIFTINPQARFHDGEPIKPSDVKFSFEILMQYGNPIIKQYYADVKEMQILDSARVKFQFSTSTNRELPLILGQLSILPQHFYKDKEFDSNPLLVPLGSGPYKIKSFEVGRNIVYERVKDYWAQNHPARVGQFNFDEVMYEYYKDDNVALEAFKSGAYDFRLESSAKLWAQGYQGKGKKENKLKQIEFHHGLPSGMQGFFMNTKREVFSDRRVREALLYAFDFTWSNKNLFFNQYNRTKSFFDNSIYASSGIPNGLEREILIHLGAEEYILDSPFIIPEYASYEARREALLHAQNLLKEAGYESRNNRIYKNGKPLSFEILLVSKAFERVVLPFIENLKLLGIDASMRTTDTGSYVNRLNSFDYDMIVAVIPQSLFPGNEQRYFWDSSSANINGSRNYARIESGIVDELVNGVISAHDKPTQIAYVRALDRVLLWGYYVIPHFHSRTFRVAYWDKFGFPDVSPLYDFDVFTWWVK